MNEIPANLWLAELWQEHRERLLRVLVLRMPAALQRRLSAEDLLQETYLACGKRLDYLQAEPEVPMYVFCCRCVHQNGDGVPRVHSKIRMFRLAVNQNFLVPFQSVHETGRHGHFLP